MAYIREIINTIVHPEPHQAKKGIKILRHVMGTLLILSLIMLIVLCFFIPSMVDSLVDQEIFMAHEEPISINGLVPRGYIGPHGRWVGDRSNTRHQTRETETQQNEREIETKMKAGEVLKKILYGLVFSIIAIHLLLIWGVLMKKPSQIVVLLSVILEAGALIGLLIEWQSTGIYAMTVVFNFIVIVMALYMSYLLKKSKNGPGPSQRMNSL